MRDDFGTLKEARSRRLNKKPVNYRRALIKVEGEVYTIEELESIVGCKLDLGKLRTMQSASKLTIEKLVKKLGHGRKNLDTANEGTPY